VFDENFVVEEYASGFTTPVAITFVEDDALVTEKITGNVRLIKNGVLEDEPVLHVDVHNYWENGLLGITSTGSTVYLYFTAAEANGEEPIANRIYKYSWDGKSLGKGTLVKELPVSPEGIHSGGSLEVGLDGTVYAIIGEHPQSEGGVLQNFDEGKMNDRGVIVIVNKDDSVIKPKLSETPQDHYYAMGIRNSFGLAIDPVTGYLWDTENGENDNDEVNLVLPKFNSGWRKIMGHATVEEIKQLPSFSEFQYSNPEFVWEWSVAPTGLAFVDSIYFEDYSDTLLVGAFNVGTIFQFKLNEDRTGFELEDPVLKDLTFNPGDESDEITFASGFNGITDIEFGPDGYLYVVSMLDGKIYRVVPSKTISELQLEVPLEMKETALQWSSGNTPDSDFVIGLEQMLKERIIDVTNVQNQEGERKIPNWVKNVANWLVLDKISAQTFVFNIEFLINNGLILTHQIDFECDISIETSNLSGCKFVEVNFSGKDFTRSKIKNAYLTNVNLNDANFVQANLQGSELTESSGENVVFNGANLEKTLISNSLFQNSLFLRTNLKNSEITNSEFNNCDFTGADFRNSNLDSSTFNESEFRNAILKNTNFENSNLDGSNFLNAVLDDSIFTNSKMTKISLNRAMIRNSILDGVDISESNLEKANFTNSNLLNADLSGTFGQWTKFYNGNLVNSDFSKSKLYGVDFRNADLTNSNLSNSEFIKGKFQQSDLSNANLENSNLSQAKFFKANLTNANLLGAIIDETNFDQAITTGCTGCPS